MAGPLRNEADFWVRNRIRLRRGPAPLPFEPKAGLFSPEGQREADRLVAQYGLEQWAVQSGRRDFAASLFYAAMVEHGLSKAEVTLPDPLQALDAGAGDWFYVRPLAQLLRRFGGGRSLSLDGVELDAFALYRGFRSRMDFAERFMAGEPGLRYLPSDIREYRQPVDLALMLFPFLFKEDALRWGLPGRTLRPAEVLSHVWGLIKPGGTLLVANLGEQEREAQQRLLAEAGIPITWSGPFTAPLFQYKQIRYVSVIRRK